MLHRTLLTVQYTVLGRTVHSVQYSTLFCEEQFTLYSTVHCSVKNSTLCTVKYTVLWSTAYSVQYSTQCSLLYRVQCTLCSRVHVMLYSTVTYITLWRWKTGWIQQSTLWTLGFHSARAGTNLNKYFFIFFFKNLFLIWILFEQNLKRAVYFYSDRFFSSDHISVFCSSLSDLWILISCRQGKNAFWNIFLIHNIT